MVWDTVQVFLQRVWDLKLGNVSLVGQEAGISF